MRWLNFPRFSGGPIGSPPPPPPPPPAASYVGSDTTTQGAWNGVYGSSGYILSEPTTAGTASLPAGVTWAIAGNSFYTWTAAIWTEPASGRPQLPNSVSVYYTGWYSSATITFTINQPVGTTYHLAVYSVDPDEQQAGVPRQGNVTIEDVNGNVLDGPRAFSSLLTGDYLKWQVTGPCKVLVHNTGTNTHNITCFGLFIDP